jgi:hypothetical protein
MWMCDDVRDGGEERKFLAVCAVLRWAELGVVQYVVIAWMDGPQLQ